MVTGAYFRLMPPGEAHNGAREIRTANRRFMPVRDGKNGVQAPKDE
jgi:hypothetical protein